MRSAKVSSCCFFILLGVAACNRNFFEGKSPHQGKVWLETMSISKTYFDSLINQKDIKSLVLNIDYDNRGLHKDRVLLNAYQYYRTGNTSSKIPLQPEGERKLPGDRKFSIYRIDSTRLDSIYNAYKADPTIVKFIFRPVLSGSDSNYIVYEMRAVSEGNEKRNDYRVNYLVYPIDPCPPLNCFD